MVVFMVLCLSYLDNLKVPDLRSLDAYPRQLGCCLVDILRHFVVCDGAVADVDVVDAVHSRDAARLDAGFAAPADDTADVDVLEVGC